MKAPNYNQILLLAAYGYGAIISATCFKITFNMLKTRNFIPLSFILLTIILIIFFIKQLYKLK